MSDVIVECVYYFKIHLLNDMITIYHDFQTEYFQMVPHIFERCSHSKVALNRISCVAKLLIVKSEIRQFVMALKFKC